MSEEPTTALPRLALDRPVWVPASAKTERMATAFREGGGDITTFDPQARLLDVIYEVELHHGSDSGGNLSTIEVFGASADEALRHGLEALGFRRVEAFEGGFVAHRR